MKKIFDYLHYIYDWYIKKPFVKNVEEYKLTIFHRYPEKFKNELNYLKEKLKQNGTTTKMVYRAYKRKWRSN